MDVKSALAKLDDKPVENPKDFVDREEEIKNILRSARLLEGGIIGIAGERGVGKTSLMNIISSELSKEKSVVRLQVYQRSSTPLILHDILYGLSLNLGPAYRRLLKRLEAKFSASFPPSVSLSVEDQPRPLRGVVEALRRQLDKENNLVIVIDELDKEPYEELVKTLDALRLAFEGKNTTLLITLPPSVYTRYLSSLMTGQEIANVEGVFDRVILLNPLKEEALERILILRRVHKFFSAATIKLAQEFARGNPRRFLFVLREALLRAGSTVKKKHLLGVLTDLLSPYLKQLSISTKEIEILRHYLQYGRNAPDRLVKAGVIKARSHFYTYLSRLEDKGFIKNGTIAEPLGFFLRHRFI